MGKGKMLGVKSTLLLPAPLGPSRIFLMPMAGGAARLGTAGGSEASWSFLPLHKKDFYLKLGGCWGR